MTKKRIKRIEKQIVNDIPDDDSRQVKADRCLRDLNRIYGDPNTPVPKMGWKEFDDMLEKTVEKYHSH